MKVGIAALFIGISSSFYSQYFIGEISGTMNELDFESQFTWRFEEDTTYYELDFILEHEEHKVVLTFDGDTTALIEMFEEGKLVESRPCTPSELSSIVTIVEEEKEEGPELIGYSTETYLIRTDEKEIEADLGNISVNWHGAEKFFAVDIPFALASQEKGKFPLKIVSTDLKGNVQYSLVVTDINKK
ncbi:MAG: hypothetical protein H6600_08020 [Flavobacteriales bacterium]|nr:hypothetical protein [Flavobacteriales bacterium]MCB9198389.1 hypothetical protein [Flavobacteriales bacterium]